MYRNYHQQINFGNLGFKDDNISVYIVKKNTQKRKKRVETSSAAARRSSSIQPIVSIGFAFQVSLLERRILYVAKLETMSF